jgi:hypothetical protein
MPKLLKNLLIVILCVCAAAATVFGGLFFIKAPTPSTVRWGVNFSQMHAESLHLDWKQTFLAILEDLGAKKIRLLTNWDFVGGTRGQYFFGDVDWQVQRVKSHGAKLLFIVGMKSGRWPECHIPSWATTLSKDEQQQEILAYITAMVSRYKNSGAIEAWQAENEPLFHFGQCPWYDEKFLKQEVALIKSLDPQHPVVVSDSGEQSLWVRAARIGDIVGTTMYRRVWTHISQDLGFYITLPLSPSDYWVKARFIRAVFHKKVIDVELQAEPWTPKFYYDEPLSVQFASMNPAIFSTIIDYARHTGFDQFYFWGTEWWYWLKTVQHDPTLWNMARNVIQSNH